MLSTDHRVVNSYQLQEPVKVTVVRQRAYHLRVLQIHGLSYFILLMFAHKACVPSTSGIHLPRSLAEQSVTEPLWCDSGPADIDPACCV